MKSWKQKALAVMGACKRQGSAVKVGVVGAVTTAAVSAHAALDVAVTGAITTAQTDLTTLYASLTGAGAALFVSRIIYRRFFPVR